MSRLTQWDRAERIIKLAGMAAKVATVVAKVIKELVTIHW